MSYYDSYVSAYQRTPIGKYIRQRANAQRRQIPWELSFNQWMTLWVESGKWDQRGKKKGQYCMARYDDYGPYTLGNVCICLASVNSSEDNLRRNPKNYPIIMENWVHTGEPMNLFWFSRLGT